MKALIRATIMVVLCSASPTIAEPITSSDLDQLKNQIKLLSATVQKLNVVVEKQQQTINELREAHEPLTVNQATQNQSSSQPSRPSAQYLPDIGVVGDIVASFTESDEDEEGNDRLSARELELVLGHDIDPYSRLDATIAFSDFEEASLEELYVSYWDLPGALRGRIGRLKPKVGKAVSVHRDSLETVDEPLVVQRYFGVEGLSKAALELSGFAPWSTDSITQALTVGVMEGGAGEDGLLFGETRRRPSYYAHLSNFVDLSDETSFELGGTYLLGSKDEDSTNEVQALGIDATLIHNFNPLNRLKVQSEFYFQDRDESSVLDDIGGTVAYDSSPWGFYGLVDYKLAERWSFGSRYDWLEPVDNNPEAFRDHDSAISGYLTFHQSEFARWRLQYQQARLIEGLDDDRVFLQGTFALGTHKHQLQ